MSLVCLHRLMLGGALVALTGAVALAEVPVQTGCDRPQALADPCERGPAYDDYHEGLSLLAYGDRSERADAHEGLCEARWHYGWEGDPDFPPVKLSEGVIDTSRLLREGPDSPVSAGIELKYFPGLWWLMTACQASKRSCRESRREIGSFLAKQSDRWKQHVGEDAECYWPEKLLWEELNCSREDIEIEISKFCRGEMVCRKELCDLLTELRSDSTEG